MHASKTKKFDDTPHVPYEAALLWLWIYVFFFFLLDLKLKLRLTVGEIGNKESFRWKRCNRMNSNIDEVTTIEMTT